MIKKIVDLSLTVSSMFKSSGVRPDLSTGYCSPYLIMIPNLFLVHPVNEYALSRFNIYSVIH